MFAKLAAERVVFDLEDAGHLGVLREEVGRIATAMDDPERAPPLLWSGIPWPERSSSGDGDPCLSISVGGTYTVALPLRLTDGEVFALDADGREVGRGELASLARASRFRTPQVGEVADGREMIDLICAQVARRMERLSRRIHRWRHFLLSWGFPSRSRRTGPEVLEGLTAISTQMTKSQAGFTEDLRGQDIGALFTQGLERHLGRQHPVTVANDTVMALHAFLDDARRESCHQIGLLINGTGSNFAIAEPYGVRPEGIVSPTGEGYEPRRLRGAAELEEREVRQRYFVNYESGSIELGATRTRYDLSPEYQIEMNALSGGNAFRQQFRQLVPEHLGPAVHRALLQGFRSEHGADSEPEGVAVTALATGLHSPEELFPGVRLGVSETLALQTLCRAITARSALHAALILAAVSRRLGFGHGDGGRPDLLALEGSVWRTAGYPQLVSLFWQRLLDRPLHVRLDHAPDFNASLRGPAWLTHLQR